MIVIENPNGRMNSGERAFVASQRANKGILLVNFMVGGGGPRRPGREVDAILLLPRGIVCVEVKYTSASGELDSPMNGAWAVGDDLQPFSSRSKSPATQADQATKILAAALESRAWPKTYVTPAVALHGPVVIPEQARWVGTVGVTTIDRFDRITSQVRSRRLQAQHLGPMLARLGVAQGQIPAIEDLLAEGFGDRDPDPVAVEAPNAALDVPRPAVPASGNVAWWLRPVAAHRVVALMTAVCLAGVWQLMTGGLFTFLVGPQEGHVYFLYDAWRQNWRDDAATGLVALAPRSAPMLGLGAIVVFAIAQWLRSRVCDMSVTEVIGYLLGVFAAVAGAPVLFADSGGTGLVLAAFTFTVMWPLSAILVREFAEPFNRHFQRIRREYEI